VNGIQKDDMDTGLDSFMRYLLVVGHRHWRLPGHLPGGARIFTMRKIIYQLAK
jgi:hypothetical protein